MARRSVAVIGAGVAGLVTARKLVELGIDTAVYDQKKELGLPVRASGILSINGLKSLGISYNRAITNTLHGARIHAGRQVMNVRAEKPMAHVLDRKLLNDLCHDEAIAAGAEVNLQSRMAGSRLDTLSKTNFIIGADGAVSEVARHFSMGSINRHVLTYKTEFNVNTDDAGMVDLFFDRKVSRGLFGWFCPNSKDMLEVGIGLDSRYGNAKAAFKKFLEDPRVKERLGSAKQVSEWASIIPMCLRSSIVDEKSGVILVGDAAGQVKASTGGGIIYGGNAGIMAAEVIKEHLGTGAGLTEYKRRYLRKYSLDTSLHALANQVYSGMGQGTFETVIKILNALKIDSFLGRYGDMDKPSLILKNLLFRTYAI